MWRDTSGAAASEDGSCRSMPSTFTSTPLICQYGSVGIRSRASSRPPPPSSIRIPVNGRKPKAIAMDVSYAMIHGAADDGFPIRPVPGANRVNR